MTQKRSRGQKTRSRWTSYLVGLGIIGIMALGVVLTANRLADAPETGPMGGVVYDAAMTASGTVEVGGIQVDGAEVDMGRVPNDYTIMPEWTLTNTGNETVSLGEPHASVIEGCCPGPLELTGTTLEPGESVQLTFPLEMHPGMDGPHDFDVHVPLAGSEDYLTLGVSGLFHTFTPTDL